MMGMGFQLSHHLTVTKSQKSTEEDSESYVINNRFLQPNIEVISKPVKDYQIINFGNSENVLIDDVTLIKDLA